MEINKNAKIEALYKKNEIDAGGGKVALYICGKFQGWLNSFFFDHMAFDKTLDRLTHKNALILFYENTHFLWKKTVGNMFSAKKT